MAVDARPRDDLLADQDNENGEAPVGHQGLHTRKRCHIRALMQETILPPLGPASGLSAGWGRSSPEVGLQGAGSGLAADYRAERQPADSASCSEQNQRSPFPASMRVRA